jgi:hypothetical protein
MQIDSNPARDADAARRNAPNHRKALAHAARSAFLACMIGLLAAGASKAWRESAVAATLSGPREDTARTAAASRSDPTDTGPPAAAGKPAASAAFGTSEPVSGAVSGPLPSPALMADIVTWLAANFELPLTDDLPRVELTSSGRLVAIRLGGFAINRSETETEPNPPQPPLTIGGDLVAVYHSEKRIIYLPEDWNGTGPAETSVLVHEMVHHLQNVGGLKYSCPDAREKSAYLAQDRWLRRFGLDLDTAFGIDLFTVHVRSACFH